MSSKPKTWLPERNDQVRAILGRHTRVIDALPELSVLCGQEVSWDSLNSHCRRMGWPAPRAMLQAADASVDVDLSELVPDGPPTERELPADTEGDDVQASVTNGHSHEVDIRSPPPIIHEPERNLVRVIVPDSHGAHIDGLARDAFLRDLRALNPDQIVFLGDHLDCAGTFSSHQRSYTNEMAESYADDVGACNSFLDAIQRAAPSAAGFYLEGNHEAHVERWAARIFESQKDAEAYLERQGPAAVLSLDRRAIRYYRRSEHYDGISIPGAMRLGKCFFVHGISHAKGAAQVHLARFGASVVFGHIHRSQSTIERTVTSDGIGAWCPGTLARLQPLYRHTAPSDWSHGYGVQFVARSGKFLHVNVPILGGQSLLMDVARRLA